MKKKTSKAVLPRLRISSLWFLASCMARHVLYKAAASPLSGGPWGPTDPVAASSATIVAVGPSNSHIRFTVLTGSMVRIEQSSPSSTKSATQEATTIFEDRKTVAVINRNLAVPSFQYAQSKDGLLTLETACLTVTYRTGEPFSADNLQVTGNMYCSKRNNNNNVPAATWIYRYGDDDPHNLLGTIRTLDRRNTVSLNCTDREASDHCEWGLISRSGYAIVNDTTNYALNSDDWWVEPNIDQEDFYILGHGHEYEAALSDYRKIGGYIPLLPRYALGVWTSRWYDYTAMSAAQVVKRYEEHALPLDVFVLDMNWHTKNDWTGYSWDKRLFGNNPEDVLSYMKTRGLAVTLNLHDANGVNSWEDRYIQMCSAVGCTKGEVVPFSVVNETTAYALEDTVLSPLESNGVDFWWIDWQQGEKGKGGTAGSKQNPTIWTAHIRSTNSNRRRKANQEEVQRNMVLARWGGLGGHRYPVHFSGDIDRLSWDNLAYQPYFSMAATNVGAIWSHDIEGPEKDPELYTRWLQWGVVSGVVRTHDRGMSAGACSPDNSCSIVEPWDAPPKYAQANFEALRLRGKLMPYLYTAAYFAHKTGKWFLSPLYYNWPELEGAYETAGFHPNPNAVYESQYMLGNDFWVSPVVKPSNTTDGLAQIQLWVPPGIWIGVSGGQVLTGTDDGMTSRKWLANVNDIPMFARAGSIIPSVPVRPGATVGLAMKSYDELVWTIYLAKGGPRTGSGVVYEDDGDSTAYFDRDSYTITTAVYNISNTVYTQHEVNGRNSRRHERELIASSNTMTFSVSTDGHCEKLPTFRATTLRIVNSAPPASVLANGLSIPYSRYGGSGTWSYDSTDVAVVVELPSSQVAEGLEIIIETKQHGSAALLMDGIGFQLQRAIAAKATLDEIRKTPGSQTGEDKITGELMLAASLGSSLEYLAGLPERGAFETLLSSYQSHFEGAYREIKSLSLDDPQVCRALKLLESALKIAY